MVDFVKWVIDKLEWIIKSIITLLPDSPFTFVSMPTELYDWFAILNWFIPLTTFVAILEAWLSAIVVWYLIQTYLRWAKVTE